MSTRVLVNGEPIDYSTVPVPRMAAGLERYFEHGILPGDFLQAVLRNDLKSACYHADDENATALHKLVVWLYNHAPSCSWGSPERVVDWVKNKVPSRYSSG